MQLLSGVVVCSSYLKFWTMVMVNETREKRIEGFPVRTGEHSEYCY